MVTLTHQLPSAKISSLLEVRIVSWCGFMDLSSLPDCSSLPVSEDAVLYLQLATGVTHNEPLSQPLWMTHLNETMQPRSISMNPPHGSQQGTFPSSQRARLVSVCVCVFSLWVCLFLGDRSWLCLVSSLLCL